MALTKENAAQWAALFMAVAEGKSLQYNYSEGGWTDTPNIYWDDDDVDRYRVKPEPRTFYAVVPDGGTSIHASFSEECYAQEALNSYRVTFPQSSWEIIEVKEVI